MVFQIKVLQVLLFVMFMLVDGWLPQGRGPVLALIDGALPRHSQHKAGALT